MKYVSSCYHSSYEQLFRDGLMNLIRQKQWSLALRAKTMSFIQNTLPLTGTSDTRDSLYKLFAILPYQKSNYYDFLVKFITRCSLLWRNLT